MAKRMKWLLSSPHALLTPPLLTPLLTLLLCLLLLSSVEGTLLTPPRDTFAPEGATVRLTCGSGVNKAVWWSRAPPGNPQGKTPIYQDTIVDAFRPRFNLDSEEGSFHRQDLVITAVELGDAGTYFCIDDEGFAEDTQRSAELIVVGEFYPQHFRSRRNNFGGTGSTQYAVLAKCFAAKCRRVRYRTEWLKNACSFLKYLATGLYKFI